MTPGPACPGRATINITADLYPLCPTHHCCDGGVQDKLSQVVSWQDLEGCCETNPNIMIHMTHPIALILLHPCNHLHWLSWMGLYGSPTPKLSWLLGTPWEAYSSSIPGELSAISVVGHYIVTHAHWPLGNGSTYLRPRWQRTRRMTSNVWLMRTSKW